MNQPSSATIMKPQADAFDGQATVTGGAMVYKGQKHHAYTHTTYPPEGGIYVHYHQLPYPKKGFPYPEAVHMNDVLKRVTMTMVKSIATKDMLIPFITMALMPWKKKMRIVNKFLENYNRIGDWLLVGHYLKPERCTNFVRSLRVSLDWFLDEFEIDETVKSNFIRIFCMIIEYDDAYRYRLEDILTETTKEKLLDNPKAEIRRLKNIYIAREKTQAMDGFVTIFNLFEKALLHPKVRRAFRYSIEFLRDEEFKMMQLDNADRYHVLLRNEYDYLGRTYEDRAQILIDFHENRKLPYPTLIEVESYDENKNNG